MVWLGQLTSRWLCGLAGDKLRTVDELGEVGLGGVRRAQARQRPLLRILLAADLQVNDLDLLAVLQSLWGTEEPCFWGT